MIINSWKINSELELRHVDGFDDNFDSLVKQYFDNNYPILRWRDYLSNDEASSVSKLNLRLENKKRIDVAIYKGEEIVAWSYGWQAGLESANLYMANSCVTPDFRRQGLYTLILNKVLDIAKEEGFHTISSRHVVSNNPVIIAKLKAGFKITGIELSEIHGNLVNLTYFNNDLRAEAYEVRSGFSKTNNKTIKKIFSKD